MGATGGLPPEQHPSPQGRHPGGSTDAKEPGGVFEVWKPVPTPFFIPTSQAVVSGVTTAYNREQLWLANETLITKLQARCRGYMARKGLKERMEYLKANEAAVTNIQVVLTGQMRPHPRLRSIKTRHRFFFNLFSGSLERLQTKEDLQGPETVPERPQR